MVPYPASLSKFGIPVGRFEIALHFEAARTKRKRTVPLLNAVIGLLVFFLFFPALIGRAEPTWVSTGSIAGVNAPVFSSIIDSNGNLYVGGDFTVAGATMANRVAVWDGSDWKSLLDGLNGPVYALCHDGGLLYAGGEFNRSGQVPLQNIAIWNGYSWSGISGTPTNDYLAMTVDGATAYLAARVGTNSCSVWRHSAGEWTIIASEFSGYIRDLEVFNGILHAAGYFSVSNGVPAPQVAKWDGAAWQSLGVFDGSVSTLLSFENELYAGGSFTNSGTTPTRYVAKWNGTSWEPLGQGTLSQVLHLAADGTNIIATRGGAIAKWDGREWHEIGTNFTGAVITAVAYNTNLYVCGSFSLWNLRFVNHVARLEGTNWGSLGHGLAGLADVVASDGNTLYAAGVLETSSSNERSPLAHRVVQWQDGEWSALGQIFDSPIKTLLVHEGCLYAAGRFTRAGELNLSHIARWDGTNWHPLGAGFNDDVAVLAAFNGDLYAGGRFTASGALQVKYVARWNGANWAGLGEGPQTTVRAMASTPQALFVAGQTLQSWDGFSW